jgi:DNA-binding NtrC family response regulator
MTLPLPALSQVSTPKVIVLEDDKPTSQLLCLILKKAELHPIPCYSVQEAHQLLRDEPRISAMLIDLSLPDGDGIDVLRSGRKIHEGLPCFVLTAKEAVAEAVNAIKAGAENYLIKPFEPESLVSALKEAIKIFHVTQGGWDEHPVPLQSIRRWKSPKMRAAMEQADQAALTDSATVIMGPPYTGKERLAKTIHQNSKLKGKPLHTLNLAVLSPLQIETELFGMPLEKLQEAHNAARSKLAKHRGETLLIQNIDRLHLSAQTHLLSVMLDEQQGSKGKSKACRIISTTTADIPRIIREGRFQQDLWYALSVYQIQVPALAERVDDIPQLCENIITRICIARKLRRPTLTRKALERLIDHPWPGNLSELHNYLEHAITRTKDGLIGPDDFPVLFHPQEPDVRGILPAGASSIEELTKMSLIAALEACGGNRRRAAQRLKISLRTIYNMIERYELPKKTRTPPKA